MRRLLIFLMISFFMLLLNSCDEESTEPEETGLNEHNTMEITIGTDQYLIDYNDSEIWISGTLFGPAVSSAMDNAWPDSACADTR